jgi:flagellar basal-body rod modification protein FlgD
MINTQDATYGTSRGSERVASAMAPLKAKDSPSNNDDANDSNSTITANDFLVLLVTELQNQDPTQPTDPSTYIQQLVGVNSLEQLIQINQGISNLDTTSSTS